MKDPKQLQDERNSLAYKSERASTGDAVTPYKQAATPTAPVSKYTTVRIQPSRAQLWQAIQLVKALGGNPDGKSNTWIVQVLFDSLLETYLEKGIIQPISNEDAIIELRKWKGAQLPSGASIESLEQIKQVEEETSSPARKAAENFADDISKAVGEQDMEGIGDLFDFSEFAD